MVHLLLSDQVQVGHAFEVASPASAQFVAVLLEVAVTDEESVVHVGEVF